MTQRDSQKLIETKDDKTMDELRQGPEKRQIPDQLERLGAEIGELQKATEELLIRLMPVMRQANAEESGVARPLDSDMVELASCIRNEKEKISSVLGIIQTALQGLEL